MYGKASVLYLTGSTQLLHFEGFIFREKLFSLPLMSLMFPYKMGDHCQLLVSVQAHYKLYTCVSIIVFFIFILTFQLSSSILNTSFCMA